MQFTALTQIAGMRIGAYQFNQRVTTQRLRERPGRSLVQPHQRRLQRDIAVHSQL
jgi:hypothetical protein